MTASTEQASHPWLPSLPGAAKDVGVGGQINEAGNLLLHRTALDLHHSTDVVVLPIPHQQAVKATVLWEAPMTLHQVLPKT